MERQVFGPPDHLRDIFHPLPAGCLIESRRSIPGMMGFEEMVVRNWEEDKDALFIARFPMEWTVVNGKRNPCSWVRFPHLAGAEARDKVTNEVRKIVMDRLLANLKEWEVPA